MIKKWGNKFIVDVSSKQLRYAVPIIAPAGMLDLESFKTDKQLDATVALCTAISNYGMNKPNYPEEVIVSCNGN